MNKIIKVVVAVVILAVAVIGYSSDQGNILDKFGSEQKSEYTPIPEEGPLPKQLFGLTRVSSDGSKWKNASGEIVYEQARNYQGGSKSQPLAVERIDGCAYNKNKVVEVEVDSTKYPASALHIYLATRAGVPKILHVNRNPDYDLRGNSLEGIPSNSTNDRDEYPFALSNEAVVYNRKVGTSDIAYIPYSDNRGSGSSMGNQLSDYCTGQPFKIVLAK